MRTNNRQLREAIVALAVLVPLILLGIASAFSGYSAPTEGEWFNSSWNFRIKVEINTTSINATDWPIEIPINFSDMTGNTTLVFDNNSLRVLEYNTTTWKVIHEVPSQFDPELGYHNMTNSFGEIVFNMNGTTPPDSKREMFLVFTTQKIDQRWYQ
jgi:hypothetical protein